MKWANAFVRISYRPHFLAVSQASIKYRITCIALIGVFYDLFQVSHQSRCRCLQQESHRLAVLFSKIMMRFLISMKDISSPNISGISPRNQVAVAETVFSAPPGDGWVPDGFICRPGIRASLLPPFLSPVLQTLLVFVVYAAISYIDKIFRPFQRLDDREKYGAWAWG